MDRGAWWATVQGLAKRRLFRFFLKQMFLIFLSHQFPNLFIILLHCVYFCEPTESLLGTDSLNNQLRS